MKPNKPTIYIQNNTNQTLPVTLFLQNPFDDLANKNGAAWNICPQLFSSLTTVSIQAMLPGGSFNTFTANITTQSLQGVVDALNSLNVGVFENSVVNGVNFIAGYSSAYTYGNLVISDNAVASIVQFEWEFIGADDQGNLEFDVEDDTTATTLFFIQGPPGPGITSGSGNSVPNPVSKGDSVRFQSSWTLVRDVSAQLFINGCLSQTFLFPATTGAFFSVDFDRNEDEYSMVITLSAP